MLNEPLNEFAMSSFGGIMQDRLSLLGLYVDVCTTLNEPLNQFPLALLGCIKQSGPTIVLCVDVCVMLNEPLNQFPLTILGGKI